MLLSVALILAGTAMTFVHHVDYLTSTGRLDGLLLGNPPFPTTLGAVIRGLGAFQGRSFVTLGLLVLIATPVMRVAVSVFAFLQLGDRVFALITTGVPGMLLVALFLGKAGG